MSTQIQLYILIYLASFFICSWMLTREVKKGMDLSTTGMSSKRAITVVSSIPFINTLLIIGFIFISIYFAIKTFFLLIYVSIIVWLIQRKAKKRRKESEKRTAAAHQPFTEEEVEMFKNFADKLREEKIQKALEEAGLFDIKEEEPFNATIPVPIEEEEEEEEEDYGNEEVSSLMKAIKQYNKPSENEDSDEENRWNEDEAGKFDSESFVNQEEPIVVTEANSEKIRNALLDVGFEESHVTALMNEGFKGFTGLDDEIVVNAVLSSPKVSKEQKINNALKEAGFEI